MSGIYGLAKGSVGGASGNGIIKPNTINSADLIGGACYPSDLRTTTGSTAGTLLTNTAVSFAMNAYSFAPDISIETTQNVIEAAAAGPAQVDQPRVRLRNNDVVTRAYQAAWRYMNP